MGKKNGLEPQINTDDTDKKNLIRVHPCESVA